MQNSRPTSTLLVLSFLTVIHFDVDFITGREHIESTSTILV